MVRVFKCVSANMFFVEFAEIKSQFYGGYLWSEGYAVEPQATLLAQRSKNISTESKPR
jgi:hypothetical protein